MELVQRGRVRAGQADGDPTDGRSDRRGILVGRDFAHGGHQHVRVLDDPLLMVQERLLAMARAVGCQPDLDLLGGDRGECVQDPLLWRPDLPRDAIEDREASDVATFGRRHHRVGVEGQSECGHGAIRVVENAPIDGVGAQDERVDVGDDRVRDDVDVSGCGEYMYRSVRADNGYRDGQQGCGKTREPHERLVGQGNVRVPGWPSVRDHRRHRPGLGGPPVSFASASALQPSAKACPACLPGPPGGNLHEPLTNVWRLRAGVTQLAECQLPKLNVAGSIPVSRSTVMSRDIGDTRDHRVAGDPGHRPGSFRWLRQ
jgi:hypothetical protein